MWIVFALTALLFWSGSDLFSKISSKPTDKYSHWKIVMAVGGVMGLHALYELFVSGVEFGFGDIITYLPASVLYIGAMLLGYIGLRYIELSVSSPICNCSGALASLILIVFFYSLAEISSTTMLILTLTGILFCGVGVVSLSVVETRESQEIKDLRRQKANVKYTASIIAILFPILYCLLDAGGTIADYTILQNVDESVANIAYELTFLAMAIGSAIYVYGIKREKFSLKAEYSKGVAGICETAGQFAYIFAIGANAVFAAPIISCYCVLSVIWGRIFLKERLSKAHYLSILITLIGIAILAVIGG